MRILRLRIEDVGLIERAEIVFADGLTVFSGETGSGKTMVLGALALILAERGAVAVLRTGSERARISLEFQPDDRCRSRCAQLDVPLDVGEDGVVVREIREGGRSSFRCNGQPVTAGVIRELFADFVEYVGQHEQQRLLSATEHALLLDRFAGPEVFALRADLERAVRAVHDFENDERELSGVAAHVQMQIDAATTCINDVAEVAPLPDEDLRLREERERLRHGERIREGLQAAATALDADDSGAAAKLGLAVMHVASLEKFGEEFSTLRASLQALQAEASDAANAVLRTMEHTPDADAQALERIVERIEVLDRLKRRYGGGIATALAQAEAARELLDVQHSRDSRLAQCIAQLAAARVRRDEIATELTRRRVAAAPALEAAVEAEIHGLAMPAARFTVVFEPYPQITGAGAERVNFYLAANSGTAAQPLAKAASGGELSRILLGLMSVFSAQASPAAIVFDEIDAGIGGATALAVSDRLAKLSAHAQIICVTHLAQIAAHATRHIRVDKATVHDRTRVDLTLLTEPAARVDEVARMLSGDKSEVSREHAAALIKRFSQAAP